MSTDPGLILDAYAGPGGWSEGLRLIGLTDLGVEVDHAACATRKAAGHRTIRADVATFPLDPLAGRVSGLIMSPPCQAFSMAGKGAGRDAVAELGDAITRGDWTWSHDDDRVRHVLEVGRWAETLRPRWIVCEQVPPVLPLWQAYAERWRARFGWSTWAGVLCAADWGVPQTRRRAFLIARTDGAPALPPEPTHCEGGALTLTGELAPWVTMAEALGWGYDHRGAPTVTGGGGATGGPEPFGHAARDALRSWVLDTEPAPTLTGTAGGKGVWVFRQPATTVAGDPRITARCHHDEGSQGARAVTVEQAMTGDYDGTEAIRLTIRDALLLQSFPGDYPVQGTRTKQFEQVGNAVPPRLAAHVIGALTGRTITEEHAAA